MRRLTLLNLGGTLSVFIIAFNALDSVFRGIGDSRMALVTVEIACGVNSVGVLLLVSVFHMALQDLLVSISFLVVLAIGNSPGLIRSAGVAEKLCGWYMARCLRQERALKA